MIARATLLAPWHSLPEEGRAAWATFLRAHAEIVRRLDTELEAAHGLPLTSYDALVQLSLAEGGELRMAELADAVLLSRSGLTRLVDRLEREGLVERRRCTADARATYARLTERGLERLAEAMPTHVDGIRRLVVDRLDAEELRTLAGLLGRLRADADEDDR
jgi:DNA-binding MarR family transcriptional regulator